MIFPKVNEASLNKGSFFISMKTKILNCIISFHKRGHRKPNNLPSNYLQIYFQVCIFASNDFQRMEITDCIFENCDFSGCILTKACCIA